MAIKDIMQKMQGLADKVATRRERDQRPPLSTMPNGSVSGYQPKVNRPQRPAAAPQGAQQHPAAGFGNMRPMGVDPASVAQFVPLQSAPPQPVPQQGMPQQPYGNQATSQPMPPPQTMGTMQQPVQPPQGAYQPRHQSPQQQTGYTQQHSYVWQMPGVEQTGYGQQTTWQQPARPEQNAPVQQGVTQNTGYTQQALDAVRKNGVDYFPGTVVDQEGNTYAMTLRVAQVTSFVSCYHLLEFMNNDETVIINIEQITDVMEANRCIDMIFGAAYALGHRLERIAARSVYISVPNRVQLLPVDSMLQLSQQDIDRRWPGLSRMAPQESRHGGREDFAPAFGQHAAAAQPGQYARFGGFGSSR